MKHEYLYQRQVDFHETDMAGIVHFSNYLRYMEAAELDMYQAYGIPLHDENHDIEFGLPRVHAECDYKSPLKFKDKIEVQVLVEKLGRKSITYRFFIRKLEGDVKTLVAIGKIVVVVVTSHVMVGELSSIELPDVITSKLEVAPQQLLEMEK